MDITDIITQIVLPLTAIVCFIVAANLAVRLVRRVRAERRHDRVVKAACLNLELLTSGVAEAEHNVSNPDSRPGCTSDLCAARQELSRLSALKDRYYEQGASLEEWSTLSRAAESGAETARQALCQAAEDKVWARLGRESILRAEKALDDSAGSSGQATDLTLARAALVEANRLLAEFQYQSARQKADSVLDLIRDALSRAAQ